MHTKKPFRAGVATMLAALLLFGPILATVA